MSFSVFRTSLRSARANPLLRRGAQQLPRAQFRSAFNRNFSESTPPPDSGAKSSNTLLYLGLGAAAAGGLAYYFYNTESGKEAGTAIRSGVQAAKVATNFVPTKDDYTKVGVFFLLTLKAVSL
jgi:cytochrome c peroxidase